MLADRPRLRRDFFLLAIALGTWVMARCIEMANAKAKDLSVHASQQFVTWFLPVSKTWPLYTSPSQRD